MRVLPPRTVQPARASAAADRVANARAVYQAVADSLAGWGNGHKPPVRPYVEAFLALSDADAAAELTRLENPSPAEIAKARAANASVAESLATKHRYPFQAAIVHGCHPEAACEILRSANYDAMFALHDAHDTPTLGSADGTRIDGVLSKAAIARKTNGGFGNVALIYDVARLDPKKLFAFRGTDYNDHWGYPIAFPNTALAAIQLIGPVDKAARAKLAMAAQALGLPIVG